MLKIDRYIMQRFLSGVLPVLILLVALFSFISLAQELEAVGEGDFKLADALMIIFLTMPKLIVELLPVTALLGGLVGLGAMANHNELMAIRTNGLSKRRIALTVSVLAIMLGLGITLLQFLVVPGFEREAAQLRGKSLLGSENNGGNSGAFWTRNGNYMIRVNGVRFNRTLDDIEIYSIDTNGGPNNAGNGNAGNGNEGDSIEGNGISGLSQLIQARSADYAGDDNWLLSGVTSSEIDPPQVHEIVEDSLLWRNLLSAEQASVLMLPLQALAPHDLVQTIANLKRNDLDTQSYEIVLWQQISLLPGLLAMALLSLPFLLGSVRSVSASQRAMLGGLIGIGFYLIQQLSGHLAGLLGINPALVILTPSLILLGIAIMAIRHRNV